MSYVLNVYRGRTNVFTGSLYKTDGLSPAPLADGDKLRFKAGLSDAGAPALDLVSGGATAAGSTVTITDRGSPAAPAQYTIEIAEADAALLAAGVYDAELLVVDSTISAPTNATKQVEVGVLCVLDQQAGNVG